MISDEPEDYGRFRKLRDSKDIPATVEAWYLRFWRKAAGPCVDEMLQDRKEAFRNLENKNPQVRCAALSVLEIYWNATTDRDFAQRCEEMGLGDPDPSVRGIALRGLGVCY